MTSRQSDLSLPAATRPISRGVIWLSGFVADVLVFMLLSALGLQVVGAELTSFGVPFALLTCLSLARKARGARRGLSGAQILLRMFAVLLGVLALRGGVFALLFAHGGRSPLASIIVTALVSWCITLPAQRFAMEARHWRLGSADPGASLPLVLIGGALLLRVLYMGQVELLPEETYYWNYGQHLDLSYLDHPPMVAWLIRLGTALFGNDEFGVRIGALCATVISGFFSFRLARNLFGAEAALLALVLTQVLPFLFLTGFLMTPDAPLTACWAATLYFLERALIAGQPSAWIGAGISLGLGLVSKYTIGMLVPAAGLFMLLDRGSRQWLARWQPYAAGVLAAVLFLPVLIWNARHEWASFTFQTARRLAEAPRFSLHRLLLSALVLLTPTGVATLAVAAPGGPGSSATHTEYRRKYLFLILCMAVPLTVFVLFSLRHDVKVDWTGALWLAGVPLIGGTVVRLNRERSVRGIRVFAAGGWAATAIVCLLLYGTGLHYLALGLPGLAYSEHMELVPVGWADLGRQVDERARQLAREQGAEPLVVGMDRYEIASELAFYAADPRAAAGTRSSEHLFGRRGLMYERWFPLEAQNGRSLLLVGLRRADVDDPALARCSARAEPPGSGTLVRNGRVIHHYYYRLLHGFRAACGATGAP
jgi:dolichol-phosphate mannosyltransferase